MKKKHFKEGVDYTIHEYKRKKKRTSNKAICALFAHNVKIEEYA